MKVTLALDGPYAVMKFLIAFSCGLVGAPVTPRFSTSCRQMAVTELSATLWLRLILADLSDRFGVAIIFVSSTLRYLAGRAETLVTMSWVSASSISGRLRWAVYSAL